MHYESRRPTEPRYIVRFYADDEEDPESGGEWRVIDSQAEIGQNVMASYGASSEEQSEAQGRAAIMHARSLNG